MSEHWHAVEPVVDAVFDGVVLLVLAYAFALKGLNLRRLSPLGRALAREKLWLAFAFLASFLALWVTFFTTDWWRYLVRAGTLLFALMVLREMARAFGGWRALHRRAEASLRDLLFGRPDADDPGREEY